MKQFKTIALAITATLFTGQLMAATPVIDERQQVEKARIAEGVVSGELTALETARLVKGQVELQIMENQAEADGVVTALERAQLNHKANKESAKIAKNKHDVNKRPRARIR